MKRLAIFFPFFLCCFAAALPGALLLSADGSLRPDLFLFAVCTVAGLAAGLLIFWLCTKKDWVSHRTQVLYMIAATILAAGFIACLLLSHCHLWILFLVEMASAFLFGYALIYAEELTNNILHIGYAAIVGLAAGLLLAAFFARFLSGVLAVAGIGASLLFFILAFFQKPLLFPDALPLYEKKVPTQIQSGVGKTREERMQKFAAHYKLTRRETDVLAIVVDNECTLKEVAYDLKISERMVQRYMTSIYHKTDTQSRIGLSLRYFDA